MFFTRVGYVVAWLLVIGGGLRAAMGFMIAQSDDYQELAQRYLGSSTTGEAIDRGLLVFLIGVSVGMVAEISRSLASRQKDVA